MRCNPWIVKINAVEDAPRWMVWVAEPRFVSITATVLHAALAVAGGAGLLAKLDPTAAASTILATPLGDMWGAFLLIGGLCAAIGALPGWWYVERVGITLAMLGLFLLQLAVLAYEPATAAVCAFWVAMCLAVQTALVRRQAQIQGADLDPAR